MKTEWDRDSLSIMTFIMMVVCVEMLENTREYLCRCSQFLGRKQVSKDGVRSFLFFNLFVKCCELSSLVSLVYYRQVLQKVVNNILY